MREHSSDDNSNKGRNDQDATRYRGAAEYRLSRAQQPRRFTEPADARHVLRTRRASVHTINLRRGGGGRGIRAYLDRGKTRDARIIALYTAAARCARRLGIFPNFTTRRIGGRKTDGRWEFYRAYTRYASESTDTRALIALLDLASDNLF